MKEALSAAVDERVGEEGRVMALDDLEMVCSLSFSFLFCFWPMNENVKAGVRMLTLIGLFVVG